MRSFKIRIDTGFDFSCAHVLTYGDEAEKMHGHNFQVAVEIEGRLQESCFVVDFRPVKSIIREICKQLDEHTLIPLRNPNLQVVGVGDGYSIRYREKQYLLPKKDVLLVDVPNLSTELLAVYVCSKLKESLLRLGYDNITGISVEIKEKPGQSAIYREDVVPNSYSFAPLTTGEPRDER